MIRTLGLLAFCAWAGFLVLVWAGAFDRVER